MTAPRYAATARPAPRLRPQPATAPAPVPQRRLEVVPDPRVLRRRRLSRLCTAVAGLSACFGLFGVVGVHVMLAQGQDDVQRLQAKAQQEEDRQQRLRMDVAVLEAPARVVTAAEAELGMVMPRTVVSLAPTSLAEAPAATAPTLAPSAPPPPRP